MICKDFIEGKRLDAEFKMMFGHSIICRKMFKNKAMRQPMQYLLPFNGLKLLSYR